ncbi:hypothetical protein [Anaerorhabdus sp.]|uniref:hypothetical protein n=1 Tax=Anaerorhabdus sp. TaxID=1872524 RepID=UPI002FC9F39D
MKKILISLMLVVTLGFSMFNSVVIAEYTEEQKKEEMQIVCEICGNKIEEENDQIDVNDEHSCTHLHSEECHYVEPVEGKNCTHQHDDTCYEEKINCIHEHSDDCYSMDGVSEESKKITSCNHQCSEEGGCVTKELNCPHVHDENCGFIESVDGVDCNHIHTEECGYDPTVKSKECQHEQITTLLVDATEGQNIDIFEATTQKDVNNIISKLSQSTKDNIVITIKGNKLDFSNFSGVNGKTITVKSDNATDQNLRNKNTSLHITTAEMLKLSGNVIFEDIFINSKTIYAQGHELTLGKGFGSGIDGKRRLIVYGGSDSNLTANTSITILDGVYKLVAGGNSSGVLTGNTSIIFGGNASFPTAEDKVDTDGGDKKSYETNSNYNLYLADKSKEIWDGPSWVGTNYEYGILPYGIYGGGINSNTIGNTSVEMKAGTVYQIFGGGAVRTNPIAINANENGQVSGNTFVSVTGGEVKSIYGGGYNDIYVSSSYDTKETANEADRATRASVGGNATVVVGGNAIIPSTEKGEDDVSAGYDIPAVHGGSFHSTVSNTKVTIGGNAQIKSGNSSSGYGIVYGAGTNDVVLGGTYVELIDDAIVGDTRNIISNPIITQKSYGAITPLGRTTDSKCYLGGAIYSYASEIKGQNITSDNVKNGKNYSAVAIVVGGKTDVLMAGVKKNKNKNTNVQGNVFLGQSGGSLQAIEGGSVSGKKIVINGDLDIDISGGTLDKYLMGRYPSNGNKISGSLNLTYRTCGTNSAYQKSPTILMFDNVNVTKNSIVAIDGNFLNMGPLQGINDLNIETDAILALVAKDNILGDLTVNGTLNIGRILNKLGVKTAALTVDGTASGTGKLLPISIPQKGSLNYGEFSVPVVNEEYVYATKENSTMMLELGETSGTLYVDRKDKTQDQSVWFINELITPTPDIPGGNNNDEVFTKDECGNIFDKWGNIIYKQNGCILDEEYKVPNTSVK